MIERARGSYWLSFLGSFFGVTNAAGPLRNNPFFFSRVMCKQIANEMLVFPSFIGSSEGASGMPRSK